MNNGRLRQFKSALKKCKTGEWNANGASALVVTIITEQMREGFDIGHRLKALAKLVDRLIEMEKST